MWYSQLARSNYRSNLVSSDGYVNNAIDNHLDRIKNISTPDRTTILTNKIVDNYLQQLHHINNYHWFIQNAYNPNQCLCDYSILSHMTKS